MTGSAFGKIVDEMTQHAVQADAFNAAPAKLIIKYHDREHLWATENTALMAAMDQVFRRRLALGGTVFLSGVADAVSGRSYVTVVIPPGAWVQFSYPDYDGDSPPAVTTLVEDQVERFGGLVLGPEDTIIEQH